MIDRSHIGTVSEPRSIPVEQGQLKFFAKATGQNDPVYYDSAVAKEAGHPAIPAPPTFVFSLMLGAPAKRGSVFEMGVDLGRILHGEQHFTYHKPIHAGDTITLTTETTDIYEKKGGALEFIVQDTMARNQDDELCVEMRVVTVVRNA